MLSESLFLAVCKSSTLSFFYVVEEDCSGWRDVGIDNPECRAIPTWHEEYKYCKLVVSKIP